MGSGAKSGFEEVFASSELAGMGAKVQASASSGNED
jgi:hypothetical protein